MNSIKNLLFIFLFIISCRIVLESSSKTSFTQSDVKLYETYRRKALEITKDMRKAFLELQNKFESSRMNSWCVVTQPKSMGSVERKLKVRNITMEEVTDFARGAFIVSSEKEVEQVKNFFLKKFGTPIIEKDNFKEPKRSGYRDYNLVFEDKKFKMPFEVQIHLCNIMLIKDIEHIFYEVINLIETLSKGNPNNFNVVYNKLKEAIKILLVDGYKLNSREFKKVENSYNVWNSDKSNSVYTKHFITSITKFINKLYKAVLKDYASNNKCNITGINNRKCTLNTKKLRAEGFDYIRSVWK